LPKRVAHRITCARLRKSISDDSGVAGVLLVSVIAIVAFTALSVFLNNYIGDRAFERAQRAASGSSAVMPAVMAYYYAQTPTPTLPCPDTSSPPDGAADTCAGPGTTTGVLPWTTLNMSRDEAIDSHGNFFTYIVSTIGKNVCETVTTDLAGSTPTSTFTGDLLDPTDLALIDSTEASRNVAFAIISHGKNGLGATAPSGAQKGSPTSARETANAAAAPGTIYSGPYTTEESAYFDDQVYAPADAELAKACESLSPGGALNADISDNFDSATDTIDPDKFDANGVTVVTDATSPGNKVANFANATAYLASDAAFNFRPTVRPVYTAAYWTPNVGGTATHAGMSISTRATLSELVAGTDGFTGGTQRGITFRFYELTANNISGGAGVANTISILDDGVGIDSGADEYQLINGEVYLIEAYDNGSDVWMRITQRDDATNTATLQTTNATDLDGDQRVIYINDIATSGGSSVSYIDELIIGLPMLVLETGPSAGYAATADEDNDNGTGTGNLTLETWIRPKSLPGAGALAAIVSKWDKANTDSSAFTLYLDGDNNGQLYFGLDDAAGTNDAETISLGLKPSINEWTHLAVTFDAATHGVRFYVNGVLARTATSALDVAGIKAASQEFIVGAQQDSDTREDFFHGYISDVRVWNDVRTAAEIRDNFQRRLSVAGSESNLVVNWVFDRESGSVGSADPVQGVPVGTAIDGVLTDATYSPLIANYFRPLSTSFCPAGTITGPYQCDFRTSSASGLEEDITVPTNLAEIYAKAWGAGGGGYDSTGTPADDTGGGSGGFSEGLIQSIDGSAVAGAVLDIYVGGYGTGSTTVGTAGGGGAGSGIYTVGGDPGLVAGGGGGASRSSRNVAGTGNCNASLFNARCGLGGNGGGAGGSALTVRAPDELAEPAGCGGRGGNNGPFGATPPTAGANTDCDDGGGDPSGRTGGGGTSGGLGGAPAFLAGGRGYNSAEADGSAVANSMGGGGGGGGDNGAGAGGGEAGGYRDATARQGNGGGGGAGTADAGVANVSGAVGTYNAQFSDATRTGDKTSGSPTITSIANLSTANWQPGYRITGTGIPANATIVSINTGAGSIVISANATNGTVVTLTVTNIPSSIPGGNTDPYYSPSYLGTALASPALGGTVGALVNGRGGAIVLLW